MIATCINNFIWLCHILWRNGIILHFENKFNDSYGLMIIQFRSLKNCSTIDAFSVLFPTVSKIKDLLCSFLELSYCSLFLPLVLSLALFLPSPSSAPCLCYWYFWHLSLTLLTFPKWEDLIMFVCHYLISCIPTGQLLAQVLIPWSNQ